MFGESYFDYVALTLSKEQLTSHQLLELSACRSNRLPIKSSERVSPRRWTLLVLHHSQKRLMCSYEQCFFCL